MMGDDFHAMKRKKLQSLCKKHGIPANLKNQEMADRLSFILNKGKENDVSDDAGTDQGNFQCKKLLNDENGEQNSNHGHNDLLVASDNVAGGSVDASEEKFISSGKRSPSPNLEERIGFSPKHLKISEIKELGPETNLSPEIARDDDVEICDVEENMQDGTIIKEQVDEIQEGLHSALPSVVSVMEDVVDLVNAAMEEAEAQKLVENFDVCGDEVAKQGDNNSPQGSNIEEQVENSEFGYYLGNKTDAHEEICETGKGGDESDMNGKNLPHVSLEESGYALVDGEADQESDETICVHDHDCVYNNFQDNGSEVAAKDSNGNKTNVTKSFSDEVHSSSFECSDRVSDQFLTVNPLSEANSSDLNIHQFVVSGNAAGSTDACEAKVVSLSNLSISPDSEKIVGFSPELLNELETKVLEFETNLYPERPKDDIESFIVEEVLDAAPSEVVMNNVDLGHVSLEVFSTDPSEGACETEKHDRPQGSNINDLNQKESSSLLVQGEVLKSDDTNSPQGSNMDDDSNPEESGYPLVEAEVLKSDDTGYVDGSVYSSKNSGSEIDLLCLLDSHINAKDSVGKNNFTADYFPDQVHSSSYEYLDELQDQFLGPFPPSEVKSSDSNIHKIVASDTTEEKFESSQKKGLVADHPEECTEFYSMHLEASEIKEFETQTSFDPTTLGVIVGTCNINDSIQSVKTDEDICEDKLGLSPKSTPVADSEKRSIFLPKVLESSMKKELDNEKNSILRTARDILETCDMKENIKTAKKDQFGSTMSKKTFTKRQPLQDLQQN